MRDASICPSGLVDREPGKSEVGDFDAVVFGHEQIFALEIAVHNINGMAISDPTANVFEELLCLLVLLRALVLDVSQQITCVLKESLSYLSTCLSTDFFSFVCLVVCLLMFCLFIKHYKSTTMMR